MSETYTPIEPQPVQSETGYWEWNGVMWWDDEPKYEPSLLNEYCPFPGGSAKLVDGKWYWLTPEEKMALRLSDPKVANELQQRLKSNDIVS